MGRKQLERREKLLRDERLFREFSLRITRPGDAEVSQAGSSQKKRLRRHPQP
jgi:hypothetical protein